MIELLLQAERALEMGRIDAAETLYRQVAEADPRNAIAVVGLARVTLERGDELGALDLARQALRIDPENASAGRMVARLEEVLAYRGDPQVDRAATPEADLASGQVTSRDPVTSSGPEAASEPDAAPHVEPAAPPPEPEAPLVAQPEALPLKRRRSWLDRLLRRNR